MAADSVSDGIDRLVSRAKWARGLLVAYVVASGLCLGFLALILLIYLGILRPLPIVAGIGFPAILGVITFWTAAVLIMMWLHRARANLVAAGMEGLDYSPGWSVGSFFVPLVNLVVPMRTMRELHNRSHGEDPDLSHAGVPAIQSWWACHLAGSFLMIFQTFVSMVAAVPGLYVLTPPAVDIGVSMLGLTLMTASAWFLRRIIAEITEAQQSLLNISRTFA